MTDSGLTENERIFLKDQLLGRLATVTPKGRPHVVPVIFDFDIESETIGVGAHAGSDGQSQDRLYLRNLGNNSWFAFVVDDLASTDPWMPRGIEIRGRAEIMTEGGEQLAPGFGPVWARLVPTWFSPWGIEAPPFAPPHSRTANGADSVR